MFRRKDNLVVTQAEHSRLSGELAGWLGRVLDLPVEQLAGSIALHDWPHFGGSHADTIEIGKKTTEQQRELVDRLSGPLPLDSFTELIVRLHWQRLSDESDIELQNAINQNRIDELLHMEGYSAEEAQRLDGWTDLCDALAFYLSRGEAAAGEFRLQEPLGDRFWDLDWETLPDALVVTGADNEFACGLSLVAYQASGYPQILSPGMRSISCTFGS